MVDGPRDGRDGPAVASLALIGLFDAGVAAGLVLAGWWQAVLLVAAVSVVGCSAAWLVSRCGARVPEPGG